ncbi:MAG TPA: biotin--[acetyl-CoA-carboxylase] ligase, partial [Thermoanaerobaculia bacterium]|nr:biotin--[acetyl-CoA-carboxylase] ligase [Thermoanaerobaculia bacterium]
VSEPARLATLPLLAGVGLARGLAPLLPAGSSAKLRLKWPNDLVVSGQKIGGILIETALRTEAGAVVILGFGVNHSQAREELPIEAATSLRLEGGTADLAELTWALVEALAAELQHMGDAPYAVAAYRELSAHAPGDRLTCRTGSATIEGTFLGFDEAGSLRLATAEGEAVVAAGEVIA